MRDMIIQAFVEVRHGFSPDRLIADPHLNPRFIEVCRRLGLTQGVFDLNWTLYNMRKGSMLPPTTRRTAFRNQDMYCFAAEIAIRALERKHQTTLDRLLCDPARAQEFDSVAGAIVPGFLPLEYRWAALGLRKRRRLKPEILGRAVPAEVFGPMTAANLDPQDIPARQGLYILSNREKVLYVGEAKNLRSRLKKHLKRDSVAAH